MKKTEKPYETITCKSDRKNDKKNPKEQCKTIKLCNDKITLKLVNDEGKAQSTS